MAEYNAMYLKQLKLVTNAALPSLPLTQFMRILPYELNDTTDFKTFTGKWSGDTGFGFG